MQASFGEEECIRCFILTQTGKYRFMSCEVEFSFSLTHEEVEKDS